MDKVPGLCCVVSTTAYLVSDFYLCVISRLLETLHSAFAMRLLYYFVILSFGSKEMVNEIDWYVFNTFLLHTRIYSCYAGV